MNHNQGQEANRSGSLLEAQVELIMKKYGFHVRPYSDDANNADLFKNNLLIKNVPYENLYKGVSRSEFVICCDHLGRRIRVECRWQQVSGSVDEKLPYLYLNAVHKMPEDEIIFLLDGGGAKDKAIRWLKYDAQVLLGRDATKTIMVMNLTEFRIWAGAFAKELAAA